MKLSFLAFIISAAYIILGVFFSRVQLDQSNGLEGPRADSGFYDYSGVINVHSNKSSGSGAVQDIITAADAAGLDFIVFNESNPIGQQQPAPIKYGGVNVFYGTELSYKNSRLLLFSDERAPVFDSHSEAQIYLSNALETGSDEALILSHPNKPGYEWDKERFPNYMSGVEVMNLREVWRRAWENHKLSFLGALLFYPFNPQLFFLDIYSDEALSVDKWDSWKQKHPLSGHVGSDATSKFRISKDFYLSFPSYRSIFMMAKNHILLSEELTGRGDQERIFQALKSGSSYFSIDILGNPRGFAFWARSKSGSRYMMGETIGYEEVESIRASLPMGVDGVKIELYLNGDLLKTYEKDFVFQPKETGAYRVVVRANPLFPLLRRQTWLPWIFSNPVYIKGS